MNENTNNLTLDQSTIERYINEKIGTSIPNACTIATSGLDTRILTEINSLYNDIFILLEKFERSLKYEEEIENSIIRLSKRALVMINIIGDRGKVPSELHIVITLLMGMSKIYGIDINKDFIQHQLVKDIDGCMYPNYATFKGNTLIESLINITNNIISDKLHIDNAIK